MLETLLILLVTVLYFLVGQLLLLNYLLNYKPPDRTVWLGLQSLFWPLFLLLDVLLQVGSGLGEFSRRFTAKVERRISE